MSKEHHPGAKIRQLRESQQLSIEELAEKSQSSVKFIEQLEAGQLVPSLAPLIKIARGLGVRLGTFLDDEAHSGPVVVQGGQAEEVVRFSGSGPYSQSTLDFFSLAFDKKDRHMEPFLIDVHPAVEEDCMLSSHEGEEFIYVLKGAVDVTCGKENYTLQEGDSIYYDSIVPHEVRAAGDDDARILAVVYAPC
jgi:transcriptional regulator with XRE-family HTH domain